MQGSDRDTLREGLLKFGLYCLVFIETNVQTNNKRILKTGFISLFGLKKAREGLITISPLDGANPKSLSQRLLCLLSVFLVLQALDTFQRLVSPELP
jgi:hypothetical protein